MIIFVDGNPGVDLQADLVAVFDSSREAVEMGVIIDLHFVLHRRALVRSQARRESLEGLPAGIGLWVPEIILIPLALRPHQLAVVKRASAIQRAPINARPAAGPARIQHVPHAGFAPRDAGFENPIRVGQRGAEDQLCGLGGFSGSSESAGKH